MKVKELIDELRRFDGEKEIQIDVDEFWYSVDSVEEYDDKSIEIKVM